MCDETVNDSLTALKLIPYWFVTSKTIKKRFTALYADELENFLLLCMQMKIYSIVMKILPMLCLTITKWALLILILITSILMIILMKNILILLSLSDFWLSIVNLKNTKNLKKN